MAAPLWLQPCPFACLCPWPRCLCEQGGVVGGRIDEQCDAIRQCPHHACGLCMCIDQHTSSRTGLQLKEYVLFVCVHCCVCDQGWTRLLLFYV